MNIKAILREDILSGKLKAGAKINISKLKDQYSVGLAPLREALSRLAMTGLLINEQNKGYTVSSMSLKEFVDLCVASTHIESLAIEQAIENGGEDWEEEIIASLYQFKKLETAKLKPSFEEWSTANTRYHNALIDGCSPIIKELRGLVRLRAQRYIRFLFKEVILVDFQKEHEALADACLIRDKKKAKKLIKQHSKKAMEVYIKRYKNAGE
ncbi:MAG: HTH-type transcriptional repressor GlaR [Chlamydiia bacterium]|nr:HTH-type transcriptional repressor GlaR [Chlamydiia bacterium]